MQMLSHSVGELLSLFLSIQLNVEESNGFRIVERRCEHFSPSSSTETVWAIANVLYSVSLNEYGFDVQRKLRYSRMKINVTPDGDSDRSKCTVYTHTPCVLSSLCVFVYPYIVQAEEKPAMHSLRIGDWDVHTLTNTNTFSFLSILFQQSRLRTYIKAKSIIWGKYTYSPSHIAIVTRRNSATLSNCTGDERSFRISF